MNLTKISIKLAWLLRHCQTPLYIDLNGGWADADTIIAELRKEYPAFSLEALQRIVAEDKKGRYSFDASCRRLRANQGHSIPGVVIEMESPEPPEILYHGTGACFTEAILREGLKPMTRQYVHISSSYQTALNSGARKGKPVVLRIRARDFAADGNLLLCSENGVWQAKEVPPEYLSVMP